MPDCFRAAEDAPTLLLASFPAVAFDSVADAADFLAG
jgi:hypothetical protein